MSNNTDIGTVGWSFGAAEDKPTVLGADAFTFARVAAPDAIASYTAPTLKMGTAGKDSLTGKLPEGSGWGRFAPRDGIAWVRYHERTPQLAVLGLFVGLLAAGTALRLEAYFPNVKGNGQLLFFGISAVSLFFLSLGVSFPVTHHITIIAGLGATTFLPIVGGNAVVAALIGMVCGVLSGFVGEWSARVFHNSGNTHFDPPAAAIWPMTLVVKGLAALLAVGAVS